LVRVGENIGPADAQVLLSKNQSALRAKILEQIGQAGLAPPNAKELSQTLGQKPESIAPLMTLCIEDGLLVDVGDGLFYPPAARDLERPSGDDLLASPCRSSDAGEIHEAGDLTRVFCDHSVDTC